MGLADHARRLALRSSEDLYDTAVRYGFVRRFVEGRSVLDVRWAEIGYGPLILCETARSVEALSRSPEAAALAEKTYPAPGVSYRAAKLPALPHPDDSFEVVLAFGVLEKLERPGELVREARRVLKPGGLFVAATPDKQANTNQRNLRDPENRGEMYVGELEETLERHFGSVLLYRQGSVAGGAVFPESGPAPRASVEESSPSLSRPDLGSGAPETRFVLAVCGDADGPEEPYVLLDRERGVFEECEDRAEDARLLRAEVLRMQETEVQTFQDALKLQRSEIAHLQASLEYSKRQVRNLQASNEDLKARHANLRAHYETRKANQDRLHERYERSEEQLAGLRERYERSEEQLAGLRAHANALKARLREIESSGTWKIFGPYRRLRSMLAARRGGA